MRQKGEGNFRSTLKLWATNSKNDIILNYLRQLQENASENPRSKAATLISRCFVQNAIQNIKRYILSILQNTIMHDCHGMFSIQIDTTTDLSGKNLFAIAIKFATSDLTVNSRIVSVTPIYSESTGHNLYKHLKNRLEGMGLCMKNAIGLCTDGASSMSSENVGVSAKLLVDNPKSVYIWCCCHRYNLVIEPAVKMIDDSIHLFKALKELSTIVRSSPQRMTVWTTVLKQLRDTYHDVDVRIRPVSAGETRWWGKFKVVSQLMKNESNFIAHILTIYKILKLKGLKSNQKEILTKGFKNLLDGNHFATTCILNIILTRLYKDTIMLQASALPLANIIPIIKETEAFLKGFLISEEGGIFRMETS